MTEWSFLTNHGRALLSIASDPGLRLRDIADRLDITERTAYGIVLDLTKAGYVTKSRDGRRNRYEIHAHLPLKEAVGRELTIGEVLDLFISTENRGDAHRGPDSLPGGQVIGDAAT